MYLIRVQPSTRTTTQTHCCQLVSDEFFRQCFILTQNQDTIKKRNRKQRERFESAKTSLKRNERAATARTTSSGIMCVQQQQERHERKYEIM